MSDTERDLCEMLEAVLPLLAHKPECYTFHRTENWETKGSMDFSGCKCVIVKVRVALSKARGEFADPVPEKRQKEENPNA